MLVLAISDAELHLS